MDKASSIVQGYAKNKIDTDCAANLALLKAIRDNAVYLLNDDPALSKRVQEVGSAALKNFMHAAQLWFDLDLSRYNFFLMPIAFHSPVDIVESVSANRSITAKKLLDHITESKGDADGWRVQHHDECVAQLRARKG